jgi:hypothetical protein
MSCAGCGYSFRVVKGRIVGDRARQTSRTSAAQSPLPLQMIYAAGMTGTVAFLMGYFESDVGPALISASIAGIVTLIVLKWWAPRVPVRYLTAERRAALVTTQELESARDKLMLSRNGHSTARRRKLDLRARLVALRGKMRALALPAYAPRIASIDAALLMLDRQIDMDRRLCAGYDRSIGMIDVELEAGAAADQMTDDIAHAIDEAMRELRALEASQAELERQLAANIEVEQLLRRNAG